MTDVYLLAQVQAQTPAPTISPTTSTGVPPPPEPWLKWGPEVNVSVVVTIVLFALGLIIKWFIDRKEKRRKLRRMLVAVKTEIDLNLESLNADLQSIPSQKDIAAFMKAHGGKAPHITHDFYGDIYRANISMLIDLEAVEIENIIEFYGQNEFISNAVAAMRLENFTIISDAGRESIVGELISRMQVNSERGKNLSTSIASLLAEKYSDVGD